MYNHLNAVCRFFIHESDPKPRRRGSSLWSRLAGCAAALLLVLSLAACDAKSGPYLEVVGGGFIFNYRIAEAFYGIVAIAHRPLPPGARVVAEFEDPAGGPALVVTQSVRDGQERFALDSPPVKGVVKDTPYKVVLRLEAADGKVIETHEQTYRSNVDEELLPDKPLTIGPGYTKNPDLQQ